jgi:hypothetical protein
VFRKIRVENDKNKIDVYVPETNDPIEARDLEQHAIGSTLEDFKTKEIFNRNKPKVDPAEAKATLKEAQEFARRGGAKKYF